MRGETWKKLLGIDNIPNKSRDYEVIVLISSMITIPILVTSPKKIKIFLLGAKSLL